MKKVIGVTFIFILALALFSAEQPMEIKDIQPFWYACMEFGGSFQQMEQCITTFIGEFFKQGLIPVGPVVGLYHNDPRLTKEEDLKWDIGFPIAEEANVQAPLKKVQFNFTKAAVYLYTGPYEQMDKLYEQMIKFIDENGYKMVWPSCEKYLNNPSEVKPEELKTEVIIPVEKK